MGIINFNFKKDAVAKTSESKKAPEKKTKEDPNKGFKITMNVIKYVQLGISLYSGIKGVKLWKVSPLGSSMLFMNAGLGVLNANIIDTQLELVDLEEYVNTTFKGQNELNHALADAFKDHSEMSNSVNKKLTQLGVSNALDIERIYRALEATGVNARNIDVSDVITDETFEEEETEE